MRLRVREDRRRDHAEPDPEEALLRHLVLRFALGVDAVVRLGELTATELLRSGDPAQAGVVALGPPRLGPRQRLLLLVAVDLLEERDVVAALAPVELLLGDGFLVLGVGLEEGGDFGWNSSSVGVSAMGGVPLQTSGRT